MISLSKGCALNKPKSSLAVVPEFSASMIFDGSLRPPRPLAVIISSELSDFISIPRFMNAFTVDKVSSPFKNPVIFDLPFAIELKITALCEMDLSPGGVHSPIKGPLFPNIIEFVTDCSGYLKSRL